VTGLKNLSRIAAWLSVWVIVSLACSLPGLSDTQETPEKPVVEPASPSTPTPAVQALYRGNELLLIQLPAGLSQVVSPLQVAGFSGPAFEQSLVARLSGAEGETLAEAYPIIQADTGQAGAFQAALDFTVAAEQPGRVSVFQTSPRDGGMVHLSSAALTLLPAGHAELLQNDFLYEVIEIYSPGLMEEIAGGVLRVEGYSEYFFESSLALALCGEGGTGAPDFICGTVDNILAEGYVMIDSPDIGRSGPFGGTITYSVAAPIRARLVVYAVSPRDGAIEHLSSVEITLMH